MSAKIARTFMENLRAFAFFTFASLAVAGGLTWNSQPSRAQFGGAQTWLGTSGEVSGNPNAILVSVHNIGALTDLLGVRLNFLPGFTPNPGPVTLTILLDSGSTLGPVAINRPTANLGLQPLAGNDFNTTQIAELMYDNSVFEVKHPIDMTPIGKIVEFRGGTAPPGSLVEDGTCYSQTTYASLFAVIGTTYNSNAPVGCTGGQFAVPYSNGTVFNAADTQGAHTAGRITTASCPSQALGQLCGGQTHTLSIAELPVHTPAGSVSSSTGQQGNSGALCGVGTGATIALCGGTGISISSSFSGSSIGSGAAHAILNTTMIGVRSIKY